MQERRWLVLKSGALIAGLAAATMFGYRLAQPRSENCATTVLSASWADDRAYKAILSRKGCNAGESIFYSVRIDAISPPLRAGWFTIREMEDDEYPEGPPRVRWVTPRELEITMPTRTLNGRLVEHAGDDLTLVRIFSASKPDAFPNY